MIRFILYPPYWWLLTTQTLGTISFGAMMIHHELSRKQADRNAE